MTEFARPWVLLLLPPLLLWTWYRRPRPVDLPQFLGGLRGRKLSSLGTLGLRTLLRLGTVAFLTLALAGPKTHTTRAPEEEGIAMVLAVDLSGSMSQPEPGGSTRLESAKAEIVRFVESRRNDVIGLVTFGEEAFTRVPPTSDHHHLLKVIRGLEVTSADEGTALGMGVGLASFAAKEVPLPSRVVVALSDGRGNRGTVDPVSAAGAAQALGVVVHTVGLGDPNGPDPLDEGTLVAAAESGGGRFYRARDAEGLRAVLAEIREMEQSPHSGPQLLIATTHHRIFLWLGWTTLLLELFAVGFPRRIRP